MDPLFIIDMEDYDGTEKILHQSASRGIIWNNGKLALVRSSTFGYYKFPGGGVEDGETKIDALVREVREESGLDVIRSSVREYAMSKRIEKGVWDYILDQDSYYYLCDVSDRKFPQKLGKHEKVARFVLEYVEPETAIAANEEYLKRDPKVAIDRDTRVLRILATED